MRHLEFEVLHGRYGFGSIEFSSCHRTAGAPHQLPLHGASAGLRLHVEHPPTGVQSAGSHLMLLVEAEGQMGFWKASTEPYRSKAPNPSLLSPLVEVSVSMFQGGHYSSSLHTNHPSNYEAARRPFKSGNRASGPGSRAADPEPQVRGTVDLQSRRQKARKSPTH